MRRTRRDANHWTIAGCFIRRGADVIDTAALGDGFPDLIVMYPKPVGKRKGRLRIVEIKNPNSWYGKKGLNENQSALERRGWPVEVVYDEDDVDTLIARWGKR